MNEASKTKEQFGHLERRALRGSGIDIGCGGDPVFPGVRRFDKRDGDANRVSDYVKERFDFVFSSHCLERMLDPRAALRDWWSLVKEGGHMYVVVPDEDLYEQGVWPSRFNNDHRWTFTIFKEKSWSPVSVNVLDLARGLPDCYPIRIALQDSHYDYALLGKGIDQTIRMALAQIQFVLRKGGPSAEGGATGGGAAAAAADADARQRDPQLVRLFTEGLHHQAQGNKSGALLAYRRLQRQFPDFADAWTNGSVVLFEQGRHDEALAAAEAALALAPESPSAHCALASALMGLGRTDEAAASFGTAARLDPDHFPALTNLAGIHAQRGKFREALRLEDGALEANPYHSALWGNRGHTRMRMLDLGGAEVDLRQALELDAGNHQARWNYAYLQMLMGRHREAWPNFGARLSLDEWSANAQGFGKPRWGGEPLEGRTLLVHTEQGFGDTLQFSRFLPRLKAYGGRVLLSTYAPLERLLAAMSGPLGQLGIDGLVVEGADSPDFDLAVPIMELPIILGAGAGGLAPLPPPELPADPIGPPAIPGLDGPGFKVGPKIGLVWAGSPAHSNDALRSMDPKFLRGLADVPGAGKISWYGLQKPPPLEPPDLPGFADLSPHMGDFLDTARLVRRLDLVVTVDTSMAHLAGLLGVPAIVLLAHFPDWRWGLGEATPWYPDTALIRQASHGDWAGAVEKLKAEMARRIVANGCR
jgi:tetratricopeptide (TPR) repeat protein